MTWINLLVFILGTSFGMMAMSWFVAARDADDADQAHVVDLDRYRQRRTHHNPPDTGRGA